MSVALKVLVNYVNADVNYETTPSNYIEISLAEDYLIWTLGDAVVKDLMTHEPLASELNTAATRIDPDIAVTVAKCLLMDYSHNVGGAYYTHLVKGMGENKRYVFAFSFDGGTASEPILQAFDDNTHLTANLHVLGAGTPANSFLKGVCTTASLPGASWAGSPIAGANTLLLNNGNGALAALLSGETSKELYCNLLIKIPASYSTPSVESYILVCRYTWS